MCRFSKIILTSLNVSFLGENFGRCKNAPSDDTDAGNCALRHCGRSFCNNNSLQPFYGCQHVATTKCQHVATINSSVYRFLQRGEPFLWFFFFKVHLWNMMVRASPLPFLIFSPQISCIDEKMKIYCNNYTNIYFFHKYCKTYYKLTLFSMYSTGGIIMDFLKIWHFSTKRIIKPISLISNGFIFIHWYRDTSWALNNT